MDQRKEKLADGRNPVIIGENKRMQFCLDLVMRTAVLGSLVVAGLPAAEAPAASSAHAVWVVKVDTRTGKLVRMLVAPKPAAGTSDEVRGLVVETAKNFDVNPLLVDSVIQVESNYNPFAVSPKGAQGLMQLMPATAQRFGVTDSFDPKQNIEAGVRYLKFLQDTFQDDRLAIAAYNAGEKAVARYNDVPPYAETVSYVGKVGKKYEQAKRAAVQSKESKELEHAAKNDEGPKPEEGPRHILAYVDPEGKLHIATR
jgi:soluble lytic murein transglycosylase-like protein